MRPARALRSRRSQPPPKPPHWKKQNADLRSAEARRLAREALIAARMLDASLEVLTTDIQTARSRFGGARDGPVPLPTAHDFRHIIGKPGFTYLWDKVGVLDREIAVRFLALEAAIDRLRAEEGATHSGGLTDRLDQISLLVERLRELAGGEIQKTTAIRLSPGFAAAA